MFILHRAFCRTLAYITRLLVVSCIDVASRQRLITFDINEEATSSDQAYSLALVDLVE